MFLSFLVAVIYFVVKKNREKKAAQNRANAWPEALDLVISSLQSGASITESLSNLAIVGPNPLRLDFADFSLNMASGMKFEIALNKLKTKFADQSLISYVRLSTLLPSLVVETPSKCFANYLSMYQQIYQFVLR
jgi:Flp pilus assembly protein TadB